MSIDMKHYIMLTIDDMVTDLLLYHRKKDETLDVGDIQKALDSGVVTKEEIMDRFSVRLTEAGI